MRPERTVSHDGIRFRRNLQEKGGVLPELKKLKGQVQSYYDIKWEPTRRCPSTMGQQENTGYKELQMNISSNDL